MNFQLENGRLGRGDVAKRRFVGDMCTISPVPQIDATNAKVQRPRKSAESEEKGYGQNGGKY